jgi:alkanesulfonate monooxygenase SsuD/methylene tetrahydromethanopterin reductase-like flavin-dependent oxidoreductase (luciferase family)
VSGQRFSIGLREADAAAALALVDAAEREGVDGVWIGDLGPRDAGRGDAYWTMVAAAAAARTGSIRLGCILTLADPDSPLRLAEDLAMIDEGSGGRLELVFVLGREPERVDRAARLLSAWRGWETVDGRRFPVTPRPAQPALPRLVAGTEFGTAAGARLAAGGLAVADHLPATPTGGRTTLERRVIAFAIPSARDLIAGGAAPAVERIRSAADIWAADEVAVLLGPTAAADLDGEVRLLAQVVGPGVAGAETQWEMLTELGARATGVGTSV